MGCLRRIIARKIMQTLLDSPIEKRDLSKEIADNLIEHGICNILNYCEMHNTMFLLLKPPGLIEHHMTGKDRLGNPDIKFPIAYIYGDQDFFTSDNGAEEIVRNNCHFASGKSQIFTMKNTTHLMYVDDPDQFIKIFNSFVDETVTHTMELHHAGSTTMYPKRKK